jgi:hypothetical protein
LLTTLQGDQTLRRKISTLNCIWMYNFEFFMIVDSSTTLFIEVIKLIFRFHSSLCKYWFQILKIRAIVLYKPTKQLSFHLLCKIIKWIPINKKTFFWGMGMQIKEEIYFWQWIYVFSDTPYLCTMIIELLLFLGVTSCVYSIKILSVEVTPKHTLIDSVWIDHGYYDKVKVLTK